MCVADHLFFLSDVLFMNVTTDAIDGLKRTTVLGGGMGIGGFRTTVSSNIPLLLRFVRHSDTDLAPVTEYHHFPY